MNLRNVVVVGSLFAVVSGCAYLPQGFSSRANPESPERLFVNDIDTGEVPVAAPKVVSAPEKPGLKIRKSKRGNMESYVVRGQRYFTLDSAEGYSARGTASWYGPNFHGRTASNGEVYDMYRLTAAHKTLPLPTYARVTHSENGRSVIVKINDRGPFSGDRIIDLSFAAALRLGMINDGTGEVEIKALTPEEVMVLSGPENKFGIDFYHTDEEGEESAPSVAQDESPEELVNVAAVDVDSNPITAQAITDQAITDQAMSDQAMSDQANESLSDELQNALLPIVADANVQGITPIPGALQTVNASANAVSSTPDTATTGNENSDEYFIQAGVYAAVSDAERIAVDAVLASEGEEVHVKPLKDSHLYRVTVGPIISLDHADKVSGMLTEAGLENFTVRVK